MDSSLFLGLDERSSRSLSLSLQFFAQDFELLMCRFCAPGLFAITLHNDSSRPLVLLLGLSWKEVLALFLEKNCATELDERRFGL